MESDLRERTQAVATAWGSIEDWSPCYMETRRNGSNLYIGPASASVRALVALSNRGELSPVFRQWLTWNAEENGLTLSFHTDDSTPSRRAKYLLEGKEVNLNSLKNQGMLFEETAKIRAYTPGMPGLARMASRSVAFSHAWEKVNGMTNEPILMVPRPEEKELLPSSEIAERSLLHVATGAGPLKSPLFYQLKMLIGKVFSVSPVKAYMNAGYDISIMIADMGRQKGMLGEFFKLIKNLISSPAEMLGFPANILQGFVPWWMVDWAGREPDVDTAMIVARSHDTVSTWSAGWFACRELGINISTPRTIREEHERYVPPQLPPSAVEVKPNSTNVNNV